MGRLSNKVAIITGGASGLGEVTARRMVENDAKVVIADLNEELGNKVADDINKDGEGKALFVKLDVTSEEGWKDAVQKTIDEFGRLDVLVNSAGISIAKTVEDSTIDDFRKSFAINVEGPFLDSNESVKYMKENENGGSIINIVSIAGLRGLQNAAPYSTTKGALRLLTVATAVYYANQNYNVRVNGVYPSYIRTPMLEDVYSDEEIEKLKDLIPIGYLGAPENVADNIVYLASDESMYVTGTEQILDGGLTAGN